MAASKLDATPRECGLRKTSVDAGKGKYAPQVIYVGEYPDGSRARVVRQRSYYHATQFRVEYKDWFACGTRLGWLLRDLQRVLARSTDAN